jgi:hypothetical protein
MRESGKKTTPQRKSKEEGYALCLPDLKMLLHQGAEERVVEFVFVVRR